MALDYSEAEIVKRVIPSYELQRHCHLKTFRKHEGFEFQLEHTLLSGKRMDAFVEIGSRRYAWIIEFKVHAKPDALVQLLKYAREVSNSYRNKGRRLFGVQRTIIAQSFDDDAVFLAARLSVQMLQFNPMTPRVFELRQLTQLESGPFANKFRRKYECITDVEYA